LKWARIHLASISGERTAKTLTGKSLAPHEPRFCGRIRKQSGRKGHKLNIIAKFDKAGQKLTKGSGASIVSELNQILGSLLGEPYRANGLALS